MAPGPKLAAITCCVVSISGTVGGLDASSLVQRDLKTHRPNPAMHLLTGKETGHSSFKISSRSGRALYHLVADGQRLSKLLWGNGTEQAEAIPVLSAAARGCTAGDREAAATSLQRFAERAQGSLEEAMGRMMQGGALPGLPMGMGDGLSLPVVPFTDAAEAKSKVGEVLDLPRSCDFLESGEELAWSPIVTCAQDAFHVSAGCLQCLPDFAQKVAAGCVATCASSLGAVREELRSALTQVNNRMAKSASSSLAGMPSQADMQSAAEELAGSMSGAFRRYAPCHDCAGPEFVSLAGCVGGEEAMQFADRAQKEFGEGLRSGDLFRVEVAGAGEEQSGDAGASPGVMM